MPAVLIVDDAATVRQQVRIALVPEGIEVIEADDGPSALRQLDARSDIGLAIVDLNMPGMDGFELMQRIRQRMGDQAPPMLVFTTEVRSKLLSRAREVGAVAWISKPIDTRTLVEAVERFL